MSEFVSIASGVSTDNPCMLLIRSKGYKAWIRCYRKKRDNSVRCLYFAASDGVSLSAWSGPELLGLVALWEAYGRDWCRQEPDAMTDISEEEDDDD
jgi:hypothetical protein